MNAAECLLATGDDASIALECGSERLDYRTLRDAVRCAGGAWRALGLANGDRVVVFAPDSVAWVVAYLGAIWAGGVAIGINPRLAMADLGPILADSEVRYVWCEPDAAIAVNSLAQTLPNVPRVVCHAGAEARANEAAADALDWSAVLASVSDIDCVSREDEAPALWIGTSGTTGKPKGVIHPQRVVVEAHSFAATVLGATKVDRLYATSKLFFAYALGNSLFAGLRLGATVILDRERPSPERVQEMVARHRPTILFSVPTLYGAMVQQGVAPGLRDAMIRHYVSAGEALPATVRGAWERATGRAPVSGYGTSETLCLALYADDASGLLRATPLTSVRDPGGPDERTPHRIWLRLPALASGYWRRPDAEADGFRDGWFSPGDMFLRHGEDRFEFTGRTDDLLKVSGQWVSTLWVEHALAEAAGDAIQQVAAVGVPTPEGLTAIAFLAVASAGREDEAKRRIEAGIEKLPKYRRPRWVHFVHELPLTATGKLQRSRLAAAHASALGAAAAN